ncbi:MULTISPECIES: SAV_6107 family HEPN domain-containing protein [Rhodococcus]|uniref:SAV_6107 family HEPN domain-containing protein n=1 Tax=Rhodococcus TaxID=1827 RepID=UPI001CF8782B|nr:MULTISPECIES: SAV_6107 family HEPN domain-containing protein [Rhodococcus]
MSARASTLLRRADALLSDAVGAEPAERFRLAYLAALRGAGAVVAAAELGAPRPPRRPATRNAWVLMARAADDFAGWADFFADRSAVRAQVEAGVARVVDAGEADRFFGEVGRFLGDVERYIAADEVSSNG